MQPGHVDAITVAGLALSIGDVQDAAARGTVNVLALPDKAWQTTGSRLAGFSSERSIPHGPQNSEITIFKPRLEAPKMVSCLGTTHGTNDFSKPGMSTNGTLDCHTPGNCRPICALTRLQTHCTTCCAGAGSQMPGILHLEVQHRVIIALLP